MDTQKPVRLVIADDHVVLRQGLCEMLADGGRFEIIAQAGDGQELVEVLKGCDADVVIMDIVMPKLDGVGALLKMAECNLTVPVLVLSANEGERSVRAAIRAGAKGYLPKNVALEELEFAIESVLQGKTYLSPSVTNSLMSGQDGADPMASPISVLTKREVEILTYLAEGKPNREIGKILHISTRTVDTHRSNILKKLNLKTNAELVRLSIAEGLINV